MTPIVLVPGLLCTAEVFASQLPALWSIGPVTVANTLDGETLPEIAANILACAPRTFALAGISMGGYICLEIVRQAPERVFKLALLDTSARPDTPAQTAQRRALIARAQAGDASDFETLAGEAFGATLHPAHRGDPALRAIGRRMASAIGLAGFARQTQAVIARGDSRPHLAGIAVATLVLVGDSDPLTPPECSAEIAKAIPHALLVEVPQCGHASTLEQPERVTLALVDWLSGGARSGSGNA